MTVIDPNRPYNDLPPLPPKADIESKAILKACIEARTALGELRQAAKLIPNQSMLINTLPVLEARDSSEIENIVTTSDQLFQFAQLNPDRADPATKEALRYQSALKEGFVSLEHHPLTMRTAVSVCSRIKNQDMNIRKVPGTQLKNTQTGETIFTPPQGEILLRDLLANWERFLHDNLAIDPLIRMAVGHYQFEAIHPFVDGNGRTGRILNVLFLVDQGLLDIPVLYLSRYILATRADYYKRLHAVTFAHDWEAWIIYMLDAVKSTSTWTYGKIAGIRALLDETTARVRSEADRIYSRELIEVIFTQPYSRITDVVQAGIAKREAASQYLRKLCEIRILEERKIGRDKLFINRELFSLLNTG